jgi:hypothetical protein
MPHASESGLFGYTLTPVTSCSIISYAPVSDATLVRAAIASNATMPKAQRAMAQQTHQRTFAT